MSNNTDHRRPLPKVEEWNRPFFEAGREGKLLLQRGPRGDYFYYPRLMCPYTGSRDLTWVEASGRGTLFSYTWVHRPEHPYFYDQVPIAMGTIALEEGPMMFARLRVESSEQLRLDARVKAEFEQIAPNTWLPVFRVIEEESDHDR